MAKNPNAKFISTPLDTASTSALVSYLADSGTLVRHNLPVAIIACNDVGWGIERELQRALNGGARPPFTDPQLTAKKSRR